MKKPKPAKPSPHKRASYQANIVTLKAGADEDRDQVEATAMVSPYISNAAALARFGKNVIGECKLDKLVTALIDAAKAVQANDLANIEAILVSQALALNTMFAELTLHSAGNLHAGGYMDAASKYLAMALKAQNQCRMTLETLSNIKNPPVIYARQANISNGPQQVNNGSASPSHAAEKENLPNKVLEQNHEVRMDAGTPGKSGESDPALEAMATVNRA